MISHFTSIPPSWMLIRYCHFLWLPLHPLTMKETAFQILNHNIWTQNKAHKSGFATSAQCLRCDETETMEQLRHGCPHYGAKVRSRRSLTKALTAYSCDYVLTLVLIPLELGYNKLHPSILLNVQDATTQKTLILLLLQEIKRDFIYRHAQLTTTATPRKNSPSDPGPSTAWCPSWGLVWETANTTT